MSIRLPVHAKSKSIVAAAARKYVGGRKFHAAALTAAVLFAAAQVQPASAASTYTWTDTAASTTLTWSTGGWGNPVPVAGDTVNITSALAGAETIAVFNTGNAGLAAKTMGSLNIGSTGGAFKFTLGAGSGSGNLILDNGGAGATIAQIATSAGDTIIAPISMADTNATTALTITNASANVFAVSGAITSTNTGSNLLLSAGAAGGFTIGSANNQGTITNNGVGAGTATITVGGTNVTSYTENSTTSALTITTLNANSAGTTLTNSSGTKVLTVGTVATTAGNLIFNNNSATAGGITLAAVNNAGTLTNSGTNAGTGTTTITGIIGPNVLGVIEDSATSTLALGGVNTFTHNINIKQGTLTSTSNTTPFGTGAGTIFIGDNSRNANATLVYGGTSVTVSNPLNIVAVSGGTLSINGQTNSNTFTGAVSLNNALTLADLTAAKILTLSGQITGSSLITVGSTNLGIVALTNASNASSFSGGVQINAGTLSFTAGGLGSGNVSFGGNGILQWGTATTSDLGTSISALTGTTIASLDLGANNVTLASNNALTGASTSGFTKLAGSAGILTLSGANSFSGTYTPATTGGSTLLMNTNALQNATVNLLTAITVGGLSFDSSITANSRLFTVGGLTGGGKLVLQDNAGTPDPITLAIGNNNANTTYTGIASGAGAINKVGGGVLTLGGASTFTGNLNINTGIVVANAAGVAGTSGPLGKGSTFVNTSGELQVTTGNALLGSSSIVLNGGILDGFNASTIIYGGNTSVTACSTIINDRSSAGASVNNTYGTLAIGASQLNVTSAANFTSGTATVTFGNTTLSGNPTFNVTNNAGATDTTVLALGNVDNAGISRTVNFTGTGQFTLGTLIGAGDFTLNSAGSNFGITVAGDTGGGNLINASAGSFVTTITGAIGSTVAGVIQDSATSILAINGTNLFTTNAIIKQGTLTSNSSATPFGNGGTIVIGDATRNASATLLYTGTGVTVSNPITVAAASAGTLSINGQTNTNALTGNITLNNALTVAELTTAKTITLGGIISGNFPVSTGSGNIGTVSLTNANTYTGVTTVDSGILNSAKFADEGNPSGIGQGALGGTAATSASDLVFGGGTLQYTGTTAASTNRLFTIGDANGKTATLDSSGSTAGTLAWTNTGAIAFSATVAPHTLTFGGSFTTASSFAPLIADQDPTLGPTLVTKTGAGAWMLTNANSYSGGTTVSGGTLESTVNNGFGSGLVTVTAGQAFAAGATYTNNWNLAGGTLEVGATTISGTITLTANSQISNFTQNSTATISGPIIGNFGVNFAGSAGVVETIVLSNPGNTYSGDTQLTVSSTSGRNQILSLGVNNVLPFGAGKGNLVLAASSEAGTLFVQLNGNTESINGLSSNIPVNASGNANIQSVQNGSTTPGTLILGYNNATATYVGGIQDGGAGALSLTKVGSGTQTLSGVSSYSGATTISEGTLDIDYTIFGTGLTASPVNYFTPNSPVALAPGTTFAINGRESGAAAVQNSVGFSAAHGITLNDSSNEFVVGQTLTLSNVTGTGTIIASPVYITAITNPGTATATIWLNGRGGTNGSSLQATVTSSATTSATSQTLKSLTLSGSAALEADGPFATTGPITLGTTSNTITGTGTLTLQGSATGILTPNVQVTALAKAGTGTWTLTNASNSYTGLTTITGGTLALSAASNNIANSSEIIVGAAAGDGSVLDVTAISGFTLGAAQTLAGHGHVNGSVTTASGSHLAPGNSLGTLTFNNDLGVVAGTSLDYDLAAPNTSDLSVVVGTLTLSTTPGSILVNLTDAGGMADGVYTLFTYGTLAGGASPDFNSTFTVNSTPLAGQTYTFSNTGASNGEIDLTIAPAAVPEPASLALLGLGSVLLLRRKRRI